MALKKCKECGHEVSTKAKACPNCGARIGRSSAAGCLSLAVILVLVFVVWGRACNKSIERTAEVTTPVPAGESPPKKGTEPQRRTTTRRDVGRKSSSVASLKASVHFTGTKFTITNNDVFDWTNVKMEINGGLIRGGHTLKHPVMAAGQTYTVGAMQFAKGDGERFNPFTMKPNKFDIYSRDDRGIAKGLWVGGWK